MAKTKIGDVFFVKTDQNIKKHFQYIANDLTQLNSDVIRVFKKEYHINDSPELTDIVNGEVEFYSHCIIKWGIKLGHWQRIENNADIGKIDHILFRDSGDYGNRLIKVSNDWWVWKINNELKWVGKLTGKNLGAEIGIVINADSIVYRMRTGHYNFAYPGF